MFELKEKSFNGLFLEKMSLFIYLLITFRVTLLFCKIHSFHIFGTDDFFQPFAALRTTEISIV